MSPIEPFRIDIPDEKLNRLKQKLALTDFPDDVFDPVSSWDRGVPFSEVNRLTKYWANDFNWRKVEANLNELPQYLTSIDVVKFGSFDIHFIHQPATGTHAIPLLFLHGWPGSFLEVTKMLPNLVREEESFSFHVVAPSLIDFGFSSASKEPGFHVDEHAEVYHKMMLSLGYSEYVVQAGDLGSLIGRVMAQNYPRNILAFHTNSPIPCAPAPPVSLNASDIAGLQRTEKFQANGAGYLKLLSTKPQTLAYSLTDSPIGLLSFLYEKMHDWTDQYEWTDEEILTWVSIYWFSTAGPGASGKLYYDNENRKPQNAWEKAQETVKIPLGVARFEKDIMLLPTAWNSSLGEVVQNCISDTGGHFAAWEKPNVIVDELRKMCQVIDLKT